MVGQVSSHFKTTNSRHVLVTVLKLLTIITFCVNLIFKCSGARMNYPAATYVNDGDAQVAVAATAIVEGRTLPGQHGKLLSPKLSNRISVKLLPT